MALVLHSTTSVTISTELWYRLQQKQRLIEHPTWVSKRQITDL